jgi:hypothetical protein
VSTRYSYTPVTEGRSDTAAAGVGVGSVIVPIVTTNRYGRAMTTDPRAALDRLIAALEAHLQAAGRRHGEADPAVVAAYQTLADAFETYDEALYTAYDEVTPFILYDDAADEEEDEEGEEDEDEEEDDEDEDEDEEDDDEDFEDVEDLEEEIDEESDEDDDLDLDEGTGRGIRPGDRGVPDPPGSRKLSAAQGRSG